MGTIFDYICFIPIGFYKLTHIEKYSMVSAPTTKQAYAHELTDIAHSK
jgi:hypothetical protein